MGEQPHVGHLKQWYMGEELWWHCFKEIRPCFHPLYLDAAQCLQKHRTDWFLPPSAMAHKAL